MRHSLVRTVIGLVPDVLFWAVCRLTLRYRITEGLPVIRVHRVGWQENKAKECSHGRYASHLALGSRPFSTSTGGRRCRVTCSYAYAQPSKSPSFHGRADSSKRSEE